MGRPIERLLWNLWLTNQQPSTGVDRDWWWGESRHGPTDKMYLPAQARRPGSPRQTRSIPVDGRVDKSQMLVSANRLTDKQVCFNRDASDGRCD